MTCRIRSRLPRQFGARLLPLRRKGLRPANGGSGRRFVGGRMPPAKIYLLGIAWTASLLSATSQGVADCDFIHGAAGKTPVAQQCLLVGHS